LAALQGVREGDQARITEERQALEGELEKVRQELAILQDKRDGDQARAAQERHALEADLEKARQELSALQGEREGDQARIAQERQALETELETTRQELAGLREELHAHHDHHSQELVALQSELVKTRQESADLRQEHDALHNRHGEDRTILQAELEKARQKMAALQQHHAEIVDRHEEGGLAFQAELVRMRQELTDVSRSREEARQQLEEANNEKMILAADREQLRTTHLETKRAFQAETAWLTEELAHARRVQDVVERECKTLREEVASKSEAVQKAQELSEETRSLKAELDRLLGSDRALQEELASARRQNAEMQNALVLAERDKAAQGAHAGPGQENGDAAQRQSARERGVLQAENEQLRQELDMLRSTLQQLGLHV
jgi:predicted  nucleic acid-binding Zn-ribbon protein